MPDIHSDDSASVSHASSSIVLRAIIESLADGIVIVDDGGSVRFVNPAAARLFNRTPQDLVGTILGTPLVAGETTEMEIVQRGGGDIVYAELRVVTIRWEGKLAQLVSLRDVTDRKYAEERTRQLSHEREARLQAEAASRTKSDFLAIMSHELRTPLNAILGYSELIELGMSGDITSPVREQITRIRTSARHLLSLVNDILDLAKVEAGRLDVGSAPASVSEAITSALVLIQPQASAKNLQIVVKPGADRLPPYIGDAERARQILVNLLANAVKCTEPGGTITIEGELITSVPSGAHLVARRAHICFSVSDTGIGIPSEKLAAIFQPFVQADSGPKRTQEGSGLGLTIGQRLARAMGGDLAVESEVGKGSTFRLWLPADAPIGVHVADGPAPADVSDANGHPDDEATASAARPPDMRGLAAVADAVLADLPRLVATIVARIRSDSAMRAASGLRTSQVADHLSILLANIANALKVIEDAVGEPSPLLADAVEIQRLVSERHGAQRGRLGWTEACMRREFMIIREELEQVVRRAVPPDAPLAPADAVTAANRFVDQAEYISVRKLENERV